MFPPFASIAPIAPLSAVATALALLSAPHAANATGGFYNVSQIVLGTHEPSIQFPSPAPVCGGACSYLAISGTQMSNSYAIWPGAYATAAAPALYTGLEALYSQVQELLAIPAPPAGVQNIGLPGGALQRSQVAFSVNPADPASARQIDVQTWKSGSGASAASYAVKITLPPGPARPVFLRFEVPQLVRDGVYAMEIAGPSGQEPIVTPPERLQARSAVEVLVDGLPVWSSQSMKLLPRRYESVGAVPIEFSWGPTLNGGVVTLFLGTLPGNSIRTATLVMRSDLRVDAPVCKTTYSYYSGDKQRCTAQIEGLSLPSKTSPPWYWHRPDVTAYML
jgi:hypothetical protein